MIRSLRTTVASLSGGAVAVALGLGAALNVLLNVLLIPIWGIKVAFE